MALFNTVQKRIARNMSTEKHRASALWSDEELAQDLWTGAKESAAREPACEMRMQMEKAANDVRGQKRNSKSKKTRKGAAELQAELQNRTPGLAGRSGMASHSENHTDAPTILARRSSWLVKPASLSYQTMILIMVPFMTEVHSPSTTPP